MLTSTPTNATKLFLARVLAWPQEGDPPAYVNIHNTFVPKDPSNLKVANGKTLYPWTGRACVTLGEAVKAVEYINNSQNSRDAYFCTSTQLFFKEAVSTKGYKYKQALRSADNAVKMKALFIDCDLVDGKKDEDKGYKTPQLFAAALKQFLLDTGLPRPSIIVSSGGGFHMYWTLVEPMTIERWTPLAYALAEATKRHGLKCDSGCTIDSARVLRIPGTKNYKYDPPRSVTLLGTPVDHDYLNSKIEGILEPYKVKVPHSVQNASMTLLPPKAPISGLSDLAAGVDMTASAPIKLDSLMSECGFINEALLSGGASFSNPLWNLTTLLSTFTEGGRSDAHRMAQGHNGYNPNETDELYDRKMEERSRRDLGWPRCAAIKASGCTSCAVCPHFQENKSPLNFGAKATVLGLQSNHVSQQGGFSAQASAQLNSGTQAGPTLTPAQAQSVSAQVAALQPGTATADPDLPQNYLRSPNGVILYPVAQDDGSTHWTPVTTYPMTRPWLQHEGDDWFINFTTEVQLGKVEQASVAFSSVGTAENLRKTLQSQGVMVSGGARGIAHMSDFLMAWINKLQNTAGSVIASVPFGWLVEHGKVKGFVYGNQLHTPTGTEVASNTDPQLERQFTPTGDRQHWITAADMITNQKRPSLDAILASAFASPLVRFTGHAGLLLSAYSQESGIGKSTALKIAQAVWGDPIKAVQSLSDTQNSVLHKMGTLRSLPMYWDELKSEDDTKRFVDTVFRLTLGKEKSRMNSKVEQRAPGTWQTVMVAASNESLLDSIAYKTRATTAGIYRVFEYTVEKPTAGAPGQINPTVAAAISAKLHDNYGQIGLEYASYLGRNHVQIEQDMETTQLNISKEVNMQPDERFWVSLISCLRLGARYSNYLGFTDIDEDALKAFLYNVLDEMRTQRASQPVDMRNAANVVNVLARFINEARARNTVITDVLYRHRGKPPVGAVTMMSDISRLDAIHVHIAAVDKVIRIGQSYLSDWLGANNYPRHVFMQAMKTELGATVVSGRLGAGTSHANAVEYLIEIDLNKSNLMNFIDEA